MSKSRGNVVDPWDVLAAHGADAFRWYYLTTQQPWAGYRFSLETVGESVRQFMLHPLEHLLVLGALRERRGARRRRLPDRSRQRRRPTSPTSTAGRSPGCRRRSRRCASGWTTSTAPPPAGRSPTSSRSSPTGTCGSRAGASGRATGPPSRPCAHCLLRDGDDARPVHPLPRRRDLPQPAGRRRRRRSARRPTRSTCATSRRSTRRSVDPDLEAAMAAVRRTVRLGHAARAAGQGEGAPAAAPRRDRRQRGRAGRDRGPRRPGHRRAERARSSTSSPTRATWSATTVKPNYRALGPRFGKRMPQVAAAVAALDPAHVARARSPRAARSGSRSTAPTTRSAPTT